MCLLLTYLVFGLPKNTLSSYLDSQAAAASQQFNISVVSCIAARLPGVGGLAASVCYLAIANCSNDDGGGISNRGHDERGFLS